MSPTELQALWDEAAREVAPVAVDAELLKLARAGHVNREAIVALLMPEECPSCGLECQFIATPERARRTDIIGRLRAELAKQ